MHRIDTPGATAQGTFQAGNPIAGVASTIVGADIMNALCEEVIDVIESEGFGLAKTNNQQLRIAIQAMIDGGSSPVGWINARTDYAATGNGTTDDTAALQAAIDSAAVDGGTVYIPRGLYRVTAQLDMKQGVTLVGDGRLSRIDIDHDGNGVDCGPGTGQRVTNLAFVGRAAGTPVAGLGALAVSANAKQVTLDHLFFDDVVNCAISVSGASTTHDTQISDILINGTGEHGILLTGSIRRCVISNVVAVQIGNVAGGIGSAVGLKIDDARDVYVSNCVFNVTLDAGAAGMVIGPDNIADDVERIQVLNCRATAESTAGTIPGLLIQNDCIFVSIIGGSFLGDIGVSLEGTSGTDRPFGTQLLGVVGQSNSSTAIYGLQVDWAEETIVQGGRWLPGLATGHAVRVESDASHTSLDGLFTGLTSEASLAVDDQSPTTYVTNLHQRGTGILGADLRVLPAVDQASILTLPVDDTTPSVLGGRVFKTANTVATTISDFDDGELGQEILVIVDDANTTLDFTSSGLLGNNGVDWAVPTGSSFRAVYDGTDWYVDKRA